LLNYGDFLLTKIGCFRLTLFGDYLLTLTTLILFLLENAMYSHNNPKIMKWNSHVSIKNKEKKK
jgi:hypothetical protein